MHPRLVRKPRRTQAPRRGAVLLETGWTLLVFLSFSAWALWRSGEGGGLVTVGDGEVAVVEDLWGGEGRSVLQPGFQYKIPHVRAVHRFDRRPIQYVMTGNERKGENLVPRLVVRAPDGSSYWFGQVAIQYAIDPENLDRVLHDAGPGPGFQNGLVDLYARAILRDEFGRFSAEEIVAADTRTRAMRAAREKLASALERHGLLVLELSVSQPSFAKDYETTLERREVAEQDTEALQRKVVELNESRERVLTQLRAKQDLQALQLEAQLARKLEKTSRDGVTKRSDAERDHTQRVLAGQLARDSKVAQAEARRVAAREEAQAFSTQVAAVASQGQAAVRAALIDSLAKVEITVKPSSKEEPKP